MNGLARVFALLASLLLVACSDGGGRIQNSTDVRALNATAAGEPIDVLVDDSVTAAGLAFGAASAYENFTFGGRTVKARSTAGGTTLVETPAHFGPNGVYTVAVYGRGSGVAAAALLEDTGVVGQGRIRGRLVNLATDSPTLDLYLSATPDPVAGTVTQAGVAYPNVGPNFDAAAGRYHVILTVSGTNEVVFRSAARDIAEGTRFTIYALPSTGGRLLSAILLPANAEAVPLAGALARVRAVNARPAAGPLNFLADSALLFSSVPFAAISDYVTTASGARSFAAELAAVPGTSIATLAATLAGARDYTLVAAGTDAAPRLVALPDDNSIEGGRSRVRFVNVRADGAAAGVRVDGASQVASLAAGSASAYASLAGATAHTIEFTAPGSATPLATHSATFESGSVYTLFLFGDGSTLTVRAVRDR